MHSTVAIDIAAPPELVFQLARDIGRWPRLLAHYVSVRGPVRPTDGPVTYRMVAIRPLAGGGFGLPVMWRARTWSEPDGLRLRFRHLGGITAGMDVTWRIDRTATGCHVEIEHVFRRRLPIPFLGTRLGDEALPAFVDRFFTRPIAERTLATFRTLAEAITSDSPARTYPLP